MNENPIAFDISLFDERTKLKLNPTIHFLFANEKMQPDTLSQSSILLDIDENGQISSIHPLHADIQIQKAQLSSSSSNDNVNNNQKRNQLTIHGIFPKAVEECRKQQQENPIMTTSQTPEMLLHEFSMRNTLIASLLLQSAHLRSNEPQPQIPIQNQQQIHHIQQQQQQQQQNPQQQSKPFLPEVKITQDQEQEQIDNGSSSPSSISSNIGPSLLDSAELAIPRTWFSKSPLLNFQSNQNNNNNNNSVNLNANNSDDFINAQTIPNDFQISPITRKPSSNNVAASPLVSPFKNDEGKMAFLEATNNLRSHDQSVPHRLGGAHSPRRTLFRTTSAEQELPSLFGQTLKLTLNDKNSNEQPQSLNLPQQQQQQRQIVVAAPLPIQIAKPLFTENG